MDSIGKVLSRFKPNIQNLERFTKGRLPTFVTGVDLDDSFIPWKENEYRRSVNNNFLQSNQIAFREVADRGVFVVLTGIDYKSVQEINDLLPFTDILTTDNGLEMRINNKGELPKIWLAKDHEVTPNSDWKSFIKNETGWDRKLFFDVSNRVLNNFGYVVEINDKNQRPEIAYPHHDVRKSFDNSVTVIFSPGELALYLLKEADFPSEYYKTAGETLAMNVLSKYNKSSQGNKIKYKMSEHDTYFYIFFSPVGEVEINKASAFNASLNLLPETVRNNLEFGIGIGDSGNDKHSALQEITVPRDEYKTIPVYSIVSGGNSCLLKDLKIKKHPRLVIAKEEGNIGPAFKHVIQRANKETNK